MSEVAQPVHHYYYMWQLICSFHDQLVLGGLSTSTAEPVLTTESLQRLRVVSKRIAAITTLYSVLFHKVKSQEQNGMVPDVA